MSNQLKYSFKKEWALYFRRFQFLGMVLATFGFAVVNPLLYKMTSEMLSVMNDLSASSEELLGGSDELLASVGLYGSASASMIYPMCVMYFATYSLLIVILVMRSAAGGEQKKRAMTVPMCGGLKYKNYLLPKFVIYPLSMFVMTFLGCLVSGGLCNAMFKEDPVGFDAMSFAALLMSVYVMFIVTVYLSLGICTSRPGIMAASVFLGQMFISSFLEGVGLSEYHPFALLTNIGAMFSEGYDLSEKLPSILTAIALSLVICVLMYFLALGVLSAKRINNQEENKPEF